MDTYHNSQGEKWIKIKGKRKIQSFQDLYADLFNISLGIMSLEGKTLTVWSNSSLFCNYIIKNNSERCKQEKQKIIDYVMKTGKSIKYTCYMKITYFACPIFYGDDLVAICLGGGVYLKEDKDSLNESIVKGIEILETSKLNDIINLLENVFNLIDNEKEITQFEKDKNEKFNEDLFFLENKLTLREMEVVKLINLGMTNKEICMKLNISEKTVKTHVTNILRKLKMKDRLEVVIFCKSNSMKY
ncbi:UNVERIFIED_ORG: RNA polymerase subunit sigma-70 [Clostridium botulinum]|uniref:LuxR family transcriptional regulator n=1 Tax=Clostridium botulinum TaxID=1491 RepID=UPI000597675E|nr:LuxR family transcriptional regulator [Clostridium botulinum]KIL07292.1 RNA polymerase subunit sigma-70 [Clostridium botulinum]MBN1058730.1 LuxR family transcriptional regulator [Clostridium botulinum]MBY6934328.1 LuxR family transcriptional regulator [Clostridium botulinum]NFH80493.1 RNA polymerase subunit sigma-70 [Clostridium botulinum]NFH83462.1 RNA polymerase subunit sigma-70 [Clostridium botulinum]